MERPTIKDFDTLRQVTQSFEAKVNGDSTIEQVYQLMHNEMGELWEAIEHGDAQAISSEVADIVLFAQSILNMLGVSLAQSLSGKIYRNYVKYSPQRVEQLIEQGYTPVEARQLLKSLWDRTKDKDFK